MDSDATLSKYRGWLYKTAGQILSPSSPDLEDLVQEGRIAMWQALESFDSSKGALPAWLTRKARYRMMAVATGKSLTGQPSRRHGRYSAEEPHMLSLDKEYPNSHHGTETKKLSDLVPDPASADLIERAEMEVHRAEITAARRRLTPAQQRYIAARFYAQLSHREMVLAGIFTYDPSALFNSAKNGAKGKLARDLAHLREVT